MKFYEQPCTFESITDTRALQLTALVKFAQCMGYEPVFNPQGRLMSFYSERQKVNGRARLSVNTMIEAHNKLPGEVLRELQDGQKVSFLELMRDYNGEDLITALFAGSTKVIKQIKATYSRRDGFVVQSHKIEFMTKRDEAQYGHMVK